MAFSLPGGFIFDRVKDIVAENSKGEILFDMRNVSDLTIDITSEAKDATDADGALVKRFFQSKQGTLTCNSAFFNFEAHSTQTGVDMVKGGVGKEIVVPKIDHVARDAKEYIYQPEKGTIVDGTVAVEGLSKDGNRVAVYKKDTVVSDKTFSVDVATGKITLPEVGKDAEVANFLVKFDREMSDAAMATNRSDKFPTSMKLTIRALGTTPCETDIMRAMYIVIPNFQPSPDLSISFQTDSQQEFKGDLLTDYCGVDQGKVLYTIYYADEEEED